MTSLDLDFFALRERPETVFPVRVGYRERNGHNEYGAACLRRQSKAERGRASSS